MSDNELLVLDEIILEKEKLEIISFSDILLCDIINLLSELPINIHSEGNYNSLYISEEIKTTSVLEKISILLECYKGNREFRVNVAY